MTVFQYKPAPKGHYVRESVQMLLSSSTQSKYARRKGVNKLLTLSITVVFFSSLAFTWHILRHRVKWSSASKIAPLQTQQLASMIPESTTPGRRIPSILHYVYGLAEDKDFGGRPFEFHSYCAIASALEHIKPERVMFHHRQLPKGFHFNETLALAESKGIPFEMMQVRDVTSIFGRPVEHHAHKADVIRLEVLRDWGGIYLDMDTFVIQGSSYIYEIAGS
jgi:hypothetical protein